MRASMLGRSQVTIQSDASADGDDAPSYTSDLVTGLWAEIESVSGSETWRGRQLEAGINYVVRLRYYSGILPTMRVSVTTGVFTGLVLDIKYVQHLPYKRGKTPETWLYCGDVPAV